MPTAANNDRLLVPLAHETAPQSGRKLFRILSSSLTLSRDLLAIIGEYAHEPRLQSLFSTAIPSSINFDFPGFVASDANGDIFVSDSARVRVFSSEGDFLRELPCRWPACLVVGAYGQVMLAHLPRIAPAVGRSRDNKFRALRPSVALTSEGNLVSICDRTVSMFRPDGSFLRPIPAEPPQTLLSSVRRLSQPESVAINTAGEVFVSDSAACNVQVFTQNGTFLRSFGGFGTGTGQFLSPRCIAFDDKNNTVYVSDLLANRVSMFDALGSFVCCFDFEKPDGVCVDRDGRVIVCSQNAERVSIFAF